MTIANNQIETEVKLKIPNAKLFFIYLNKVRDACAQQSSTSKEVNIIFDTTKGNLKKRKQVLRIRDLTFVDPGYSDDNILELTFKDKGTKKKGISSRKEITACMKKRYQNDMILILEGLGYKESFRYEKKRISFQFPSYKIEFDHLPHIEFFIEIEGKNIKVIEDAIQTFGLTDLKRCKDSYIKLLKDHFKAAGRSNQKSALFRDTSKLKLSSI